MTIENNTFIFSVDYAGGTGFARSQEGDPEITQAFQASLLPLVELFDLQGATPSTALKEQVYAALYGGSVNVILGDLTPSSITVPGLLNFGDGTFIPGQLLSAAQLEALDDVINTLESVGFTSTPIPVASTGFENFLKNWSTLSNLSEKVSGILQQAVDTSQVANRSLQAMVELIYVRQGNQLISESLSGLKDALQITKDVLTMLDDFQAIKNKLEVDESQLPQTITDKLQAGIDAGIFSTDAIQRFEEGSPIPWIDGSSVLPQFWNGISSELDNQLALIQLKSTVTISDAADFLTLETNLRSKVEQLISSQYVDPESGLITAAQGVLDDITAIWDQYNIDQGNAVGFRSTSLTGTVPLETWILDRYDTETDTDTLKGGDFQRNLSRAITAAQNLNDEQKEEVRQQLFVFEEYYKSAAAILSKISQIIEKMAQAIAR